MVHPLFVIFLIKPCINCFKNNFDIAYYRHINFNILIDFGRVNVYLQILALEANLLVSPVTRSENLAPRTIKRSHSITPKLEVLVPCIPSIPVYLSLVPSNAPLPISVSHTGASTFPQIRQSRLKHLKLLNHRLQIQMAFLLFNHIYCFSNFIAVNILLASGTTGVLYS